MNMVSQHWDTARRAVEQRHQAESEREQNLADQASLWFKRIKEFRANADQVMVLQTPTDADRRFHRAYLAQVIAAGEELAILARLQEIAPNKEGITMEAVEAELELLYATLAGEHLLSVEQQQIILKNVFEHGAQSQA